MDGLFFLSAIIGMIAIVLWCIQNDACPPDGRTTGLLAMPDEAATDGRFLNDDNRHVRGAK